MSSIVASVIATGGAVRLDTVSRGLTTISRAVSGVSGLGSFTLIGSSAVGFGYFLDVGDQLPGPLDPATAYVYRMHDLNGTFDTPSIMPAKTLILEVDPFDGILIKLLQGAVNSLMLPNGFGRATVMQAMPIVGSVAMPFMVINQDLIQQDEIPIGQSLQFQTQLGIDGVGTLTGLVNRIYKISVLSLNAPERNFYRDAILATFGVLLNGVLQPLGCDVTHRFQVSSGAVAKDTLGKAPGFYWADASLEFKGSITLRVANNYGLIEHITMTGTDPISGDTNLSVAVPFTP